jgi:uncharacterized protein (DUF1330 family)
VLLTMAAYVVSEVEPVDEVLFQKYRTLAQAAIAKNGGHYLVRGSSIEVMEGEGTSRQA